MSAPPAGACAPECVKVQGGSRLDLIRQNAIHIRGLITQRFSFKEAAEVYHILGEAEERQLRYPRGDSSGNERCVVRLDLMEEGDYEKGD